ncbi:MAG: oxidoreductase [Deltaproteobacteria bacterium]|nr:MAG: oxidoreductase [Deltaproteobacteria bacterium]
MHQYQEQATITRFELLAEKIIRLTIYSPQIAAQARPGQFVMLKAGPGKDPFLRRPFSVHQTTNNGHFQLLFKVVGRVTDILSHMKEGEEVSVFGPLGRGYRIKERQPACLIGGGMGIAPLLFLAGHLSCTRKEQMKDIIILGSRTGAELEPLVGDFHHFGIRIIAATEDGSYGRQELVTEAMKTAELEKDTVAYACGPEPMLAAVKDICRDRGFECQVSVESVMACGIGACLGCTCRTYDRGYTQVCLEGPVFNAEDLRWNS